ncbi:GNAT family N-acetyltransferase [Flavobacterium adhaerens]|uniref:GNAT family N-acetyltransferase n=1 Tax=Flavobacterium adhaerens TaxID=3149043 RepID=UPI0032B48354
MKNYTVKQYQESDFDSWNTFVSQSKNATFLFNRHFINYHGDRFEDFSLMVFEDQKIVAVLPANRVGDCIYSHQGLSYGGLVYKEKLKLASVITIFRLVLSHLNKNNINKAFFKLLPSIYHQKPADEFSYALFLAEAQLTRRDALSVIDLSKPFRYSKIRLRCIQKGKNNNLIVKEEDDFEVFWNQILIPNLKARHHTKPVHSLEEIRLLKKRFDKNIRQFNVYFEDKIVAGTTIFESENVAHCQYISKFEENENFGSLDFLFDYLIQEVFASKRYFDFGNSNENNGKILNKGLSYWKESFGANCITQDFYEVATIHYSKLENVFK